MMTGFGQFGPIEMGGMFSVVKVRKGLARDDYKDPGWYKFPEGTVAYEWQGENLAEPERQAAPQKSSENSDDGVLVVRKPHHAASSHESH
jgi:hypothetical protein